MDCNKRNRSCDVWDVREGDAMNTIWAEDLQSQHDELLDVMQLVASEMTDSNLPTHITSRVFDVIFNVLDAKNA